ncbi:MAG: hypothetical protein RSE41_00240 [Clostridia bacterium]
MKVTLKQLFNLTDGRLYTSMEDIYEMLGYIFSENFFTHEIHIAFDRLKEENPAWFVNAMKLTEKIKYEIPVPIGYDKVRYEDIVNHLDKMYSDVTFEIEKIIFKK